MNGKRIAALGLTGAMTLTLLSGCGVNKNATIATMGDQKISLGVANFLCRYEQSTYDDLMLMYYGDGYWDQTYSDTDDATMEDNVKDSVMEELHSYYTLQNHMDDYGVEISDEQKEEITEAATAFMENNEKDSLKEMGATQEIVEEVLTLYTIHSLMYDAIIADADTEVSDDEANMRGYTYIEIATDSTTVDGETHEYTDDEKTQLATTADEMLAAVKAGATETTTEDTDETEDTESTDSTSTVDENDIMSIVASNYGYEAQYGTYDADDATLDDAVKTELDSLSEGDDPVLVSTDTSIFILRLDTETDEDATASNRESIISTRQSDLYEDTLSGWQEDDGWKIKKNQLKKIKFSNYFTTQQETETETESATESTTEAVEVEEVTTE